MMIRFYLVSLLFSLPCAAAELPGIPPFIDEMVTKHKFKRDELVQVFQRVQPQQAVIDAIMQPATIKPWPEYRANFVNDRRIRNGLKFWQLHEKTLKMAEWEFGVPQEIVVAVIGVETLYGLHRGKFSTLDALTTLAFNYPPRAAFFRSELENYLLLAREQDWPLFEVQGSYAGAMGIPQFMPSSYRKYAEDYNNDNLIDLLNDPVDAIGSVANYLKQYGWRSGEPVAVPANVNEKAGLDNPAKARSVAAWAEAGVTPAASVPNESMASLLGLAVTGGKEYWLTFENFRVITLYNNSSFYAMSVLQLADALRNAKGF